MRVKNKIVVLTLLLLPLVASMALVGISSAATQQSTTSVEPAVIWDPNMVPGTQFSVDLDVDYVKRPWGYQLTLSFNPDVLHGVSVENGPFLESRGGHAIVIPGPGFDNVAGTLGLFAAALYPIEKLPVGGGTLATVTFEVVGYGSSPITLGIETGIAGPGRWITHKKEDPELFIDGYFSNVPGSELWIREKHGTFGGGAYPEWHVNLVGEEQILYSKVANGGDEAAWVMVKFAVDWVEGAVTEYYWSNEAEVPGVYIDPGTGDKVYSVVTVQTDSFVPVGTEGKYEVTACLYFKAGGMTEYVPYELVESGLGGAGTARDVATKFKVVEKI